MKVRNMRNAKFTSLEYPSNWQEIPSYFFQHEGISQTVTRWYQRTQFNADLPGEYALSK